MKYSVQNYAKALVEALADRKADHAAMAKNFLALVRANGDEARLGKILEEAARLSRGKNGIREIVVESARPLNEAQEKMLQQLAKSSDIMKYTVRPELIAGVNVVVNDQMQFDGTLKNKLDKLFSI